MIFVAFMVAQTVANVSDAPRPMEARPVVVRLAASEKKERDPNERICKREKVVGSLTGGKKTCHTRAEWEEMDANARKGVREFLQDRRGNSTLGG